MIIRWGRKGLVAAAFAVSFVTPDATVTTSVHKADLHPSYKQVVRHVTPAGAAAPTTTIHRVDLRPGYKQIVRHVTPSEGVTPLPEIKEGVYRGYQIQEEDELLAMIAMAFIEMVE